MSAVVVCRDCYAETLRSVRLMMLGPGGFDRGLQAIRDKGSEAVAPLLLVLRDALAEALTGDHDCVICVMEALTARSILAAEFGEEHDHE